MAKKISDRLAASMNIETGSEAVAKTVKEGFARAKTAPGIMLEEQAKLREFEGAIPAKKIDPNLIDASVFANRHADSFESEEFRILMEEIKAAGGNAQPVKVRPKQGGRYEIVFGHRRVEACRRLGMEVFALVDEVDDRQLWLEMTYENEARADLSPYELAMHYKAAIENGLYKNWSVLAEELGKTRGALARYSWISDLPKEIIAAFASPTHIKVNHADKIAGMLNADFQGTMKKAKAIAGKGLSANAVLSSLAITKPTLNDRTVPELAYGKVTESNKGLTVFIDTKKLPEDKINKLLEFLGKLAH